MSKILFSSQMPKWLQGMVAVTVTFWAGMTAVMIMAMMEADGIELSGRADLLSSVVIGLIMALWVVADARKRGERLCQDYDAFVYFAWPVMMPVYLFRTRGARAFMTMFCFAGILIVAAGISFIIRSFLW